MSRYPEVEAHQTAHQPTHLTPCWLERGSADAFCLRRAGETSSLLSTQLPNRCEEHFSPNQLPSGVPSNECTFLAPRGASAKFRASQGFAETTNGE
jgi:hypothetical protein